MSKSSKKIQKNIKQNVVKKKEEYPLKKQIINLTKAVVAIVLSVILISAVASIAQKEYILDKKEEKPTNEILAGQTFSRSDKDYYVAFYDFEKEESLESKISNLQNTKIYKVDLTNAMNKQIISETSNKNATKSEELQINGTTLIEIKEGKIINYIEGYENITNYINNLK